MQYDELHLKFTCHILYSSDFGIKVEYKNWRVVVSSPIEYSGADMCGLCGNWNGDSEDELDDDHSQWLVEDQTDP